MSDLIRKHEQSPVAGTLYQARSLFSLTESPADDGVTSLRRELKFELIHTDIRKLYSILNVNNRHTFFNGPVSYVNSIYFDDHELSLCKENIAGVGNRTKFRLRWYDSPLPNVSAYFEIKRRFSQIITKDRYAITSKNLIGQMPYGKIIRLLIEILPAKASELFKMHREPIALIRYRRRHFRARDPKSSIRFTVDDKIECICQIGIVKPRSIFRYPFYNRTVLEAKFPEGKEKEAMTLLSPIKPRQTRFSKYVIGCRCLGRLAGINEL